jgi:IS5 family transposase
VVRRKHVQRSVFEVMLPDGEKLWDPGLRRIDEVLEDEQLVDLVADALEGRRPGSRRKGRPSTPAEVVLRMLVLKHLYDWSFDECEREVRGSLVYRAFCRIDCEKVPDAKTLIRLSGAVGGEVLKKILERLVGIARERRVIRGRMLRVDTTVVETNIHYPTDSALLADGVRVLTRGLKKLRNEFGGALIRLRERTRAMGKRVFQLAQRRRTEDLEQKKAQLQKLYRGALRIAAAVVGEAKRAVVAVKGRASGAAAAVVQEIEKTIELVRRVQAQTRARVFKGDTHYPGKVLSLFEPTTEAIRKGKASKPTEFGKLVKIQETEGHIVTDYEVCATRVPDQKLWEPSLKRHQELLGKPPHLATADAGFSSAANEKIAKQLGVSRVVLPAPHRMKERIRQRWFRRALRWRTGCEGRISVLKRRFGLRRCRYRGMTGMERWVGFGVIASNLWVLGRAAA